MSLIDTLNKKSNEVVSKKNDIIAEIVEYFDSLINGKNFEKDLQDRITEQDIKNRQTDLWVEFWKYHEGCSTTNFLCGIYRWYNPIDKEGYSSSRYKGFDLQEIDHDICVQLEQMLKNRMKEFGFTLRFEEKCRSCLPYFYKKYTFGW